MSSTLVMRSSFKCMCLLVILLAAIEPTWQQFSYTANWGKRGHQLASGNSRNNGDIPGFMINTLNSNNVDAASSMPASEDNEDDFLDEIFLKVKYLLAKRFMKAKEQHNIQYGHMKQQQQIHQLQQSENKNNAADISAAKQNEISKNLASILNLIRRSSPSTLSSKPAELNNNHE